MKTTYLLSLYLKGLFSGTTQKRIILAALYSFLSINIFAQLLDSSFGVDGVVDFPNEERIKILKVFSDGKILVLGSSTTLYQLNADGTADVSFGTDGVVDFLNEGSIKTVLELPDGKKLVLGNSTLYRLNVDGTMDVSFGNTGMVDIGCTTNYMTLMPDNTHIVMVTESCSGNNLMVYDSAGNPVNEINIPGCNQNLRPVSSSRIRVMDCNESIYDQNIFDANDFFTFSDGFPPKPPNDYYRAVTAARGEDYTITLGAVPYQDYDPVTLKINKIPDDNPAIEWTYSEVFSGDTDVLENSLSIHRAFVQSDDKIIYNYGFSGDCSRHTRRLNSDGSVDSTFNNLIHYGAACGCDCFKPVAMRLTSDDEIVIAFNEEGFAHASALNRYDKDGNIRFAYQAPVLGLGFLVRDILVQPDSSILVAIEENSDFSGGTSGYMIAKFATLNILPITLTDFQAKIENKSTLLTWQTATESNNAGFEIQRSRDATNWEKIAWQDGQGATTTAHTYRHRDENPLFGTSYYRLKQVDFDGAFEYTDIVQVNYEGRDISIFPNPVKNTLHISDLNGENIQHISIYDQTGRAILLQHESDNIIDVSALSSGMYIVKIAVKEEVFCEKFIIESR